MSDELIELKNRWEGAKTTFEPFTIEIKDIVEQAKKKRKSILYAHYGNTIILSLTLVTISTFFYYVAPFKDSLSKIGVMFMVGGLALRILIEIVSSFKSRKIHLADHALKNTETVLHFYLFRKKVHGPVTVSIVGLYTLGFYMLTPEFSEYLELIWVILMDASYVFGAIFLIVQIRKGIKKEMKDLTEVIGLSKEISIKG